MTQIRERGAERVRVDAFVKVHSDDPGGETQELVFRTRDLSTQGLFLYTRVARAYPFKVGSTLAIELYDFDQHVSCKVVVVRIVEPDSAESAAFPTGFAVKIVELSEDARLTINLMIARVKSLGDVY